MAHIQNPNSPLVRELSGLHLFHFDGAPCAQRVRFALAEKGLQRGIEAKFDANDERANHAADGTWTSRIVSLVKKDHLTETYSQIHPNLVVPALVHDGELFIESMDIISYLDDAFGGAPLVPKNDPDLLADAERLTEWGKSLHRSIRFVTFRWGLGRLGRLNKTAEAKLKSLLIQGDGEQLVEFYEGYDQNSIDEQIYHNHLQQLMSAFGEIENRLSDGRAFLTGSTLTMADVIWAMKILRLQECGFPFKDHYPALEAWYLRMYQRPAFRTGVMGKHRGLNFAFRMKSGIETLLGVGLAKAVSQHATA